jgi:3-methylfumaryl-CoA hydratase
MTTMALQDAGPSRETIMTADLMHLREWIGRSETRTDLVTAVPLVALSATLDRADPPPGPGSEVPPLWHWLYFTPVAPQSEIGADGHARRGLFLPPVPLPRRMWAGGRLQFNAPLRVGETITRESRIDDVTVKEGRSGALVFVNVHHAIRNERGVAVTEEHDIVYREKRRADAPPAEPEPASQEEDFAREVTPDPVLLFRYSALTFNGHRIHYDRTYVTEVEGYPGLVVHGPLVATLLLDLLRREMPRAIVRRFFFKAVRPLFDIHRFTVCGRRERGIETKQIALWARDHEGFLAMQASAELA